MVPNDTPTEVSANPYRIFYSASELHHKPNILLYAMTATLFVSRPQSYSCFHVSDPYVHYHTTALVVYIVFLAAVGHLEHIGSSLDSGHAVGLSRLVAGHNIRCAVTRCMCRRWVTNRTEVSTYHF